MSKGSNLSVNGFAFETEEAYEQAQNELTGIDVVRNRINMRNPQNVLDVYNKLIDKRLCKTPVGYSYLHDLQRYLENNNQISKEEIRPIPIEPIRRKVVKQISGVTAPQKQSDDESYRSKYRSSLFFNLIFCIGIILLLYLSTTGDNINIINYENKLIDRYEQWEQELTQRESAVAEYEKKYNSTP